MPPGSMVAFTVASFRDREKKMYAWMSGEKAAKHSSIHEWTVGGKRPWGNGGTDASHRGTKCVDNVSGGGSFGLLIFFPQMIHDFWWRGWAGMVGRIRVVKDE